MRFVDGPRAAYNWLRHDHKAVNFKQDKAPAYVVDGGVPSEFCPPNTLAWLVLGPAAVLDEQGTPSPAQQRLPPRGRRD